MVMACARASAGMTVTETSLCRDCLAAPEGSRCACGSRRIVRHPQLHQLTVAHVDCDAFYASVEKHDRPELAAKPVLVGGGKRGVVAAACYIARMQGVRSAMPMFQALKACPDAVVLPPDFPKYRAAAHRIREMMLALTPLVQPLSIDEAALDLSGTEALHGMSPARVLARFAQQVEAALGVTVSIGLAANRLMAKIAAGRDKPRGFSVIGADAAQILASEPVRLLPGIGAAQASRLAAQGIVLLGQLQALDDREARRRLGDDGPALVRRARGEDSRRISPEHDTKSISAETTFEADISDRETLERHLWRMAEKLARRLREQDLAASGIVLKLKTAGFTQRTRSRRLHRPTGLPETLFESARNLLEKETDGTCFRLIGLGAAPLVSAALADPGDLMDQTSTRRAAARKALDQLRDKFGDRVIQHGRGMILPPPVPGRRS
ncbi:DNA polymerase IV [Granulibacter bethesdensis]|nr:DNA polymerase IV [Granulibacter bethesdensis]